MLTVITVPNCIDLSTYLTYTSEVKEMNYVYFNNKKKYFITVST